MDDEQVSEAPGPLAVHIGPEGPVVRVVETAYFIIPVAARVAFFDDLNAATSAVLRRHGAAKVGGITGAWGDDQ